MICRCALRFLTCADNNRLQLGDAGVFKML
jgi:hypothetical protein